MATTAVKKKTGSMKVQHVVSRVLIYALLIIVAALMLVPFLWMLSASFKMNKDVFTFPIEWIPSNPRPQNYIDIWTKIPLLTFVKNTAFLTIVVTILQVLTSSFAAYAFAKLNFKGKNVLFLGYIATIAVPWQAYMVPQFMMMRSWHLNNTHLAIICLQAFSAFGVFMMKQFYEGVPTELCEAARIDGLSEYGIYARIMLPLSLPAVSTLVIFTFVNTWNDFLGPLIYLTKTELKTIQIGLRMFISQYSAEYGLIMAASVIALIPVLIVFLSLQKYFVQGVASSGLKGKLKVKTNTQSGGAQGEKPCAPPLFLKEVPYVENLPQSCPDQGTGRTGPGHRRLSGAPEPAVVYRPLPEPLQCPRHLPPVREQPVDLRLLARRNLAEL